jgi:hypothetical protein
MFERKTRTLRRVIEALESRQLLSISVPLTGTTGNDAFVVAFNSATQMYSFSGGTTTPTTVAASNLNTFSVTGAGGTDTLTIAGGSPTLASDAGADGTLVSVEVTAGSTLNIASVQHLASLAIDSGAVANVLASGTNTLVTSGLTIAGATDNWQGQLDLNNNSLIVHGGDVAAISNLAKAGFNAQQGGNWQGQGIASTSATNDSTHLTALGVIQNSVDGTPTGTTLYPSFASQTVSNTDVLVQYTFFGDANLDGHVDGSDYSRIDAAYLSHTNTGWFNGDFNYDQTVDGSDYTLIDNAFNTQSGSVPTGPAGPTKPFGFVGAPSSSSPGEIDLSWTNSSQLPTENDILISTDGVNFTYFDQTDPGTSSYQATGLAAGTTYYFEVVAVDSDGSTTSSIVDAATPPVSTPTSLTTDVISSTEIDLNWSDSESDVGGYAIDWKTDSTDFQELAYLPDNTTTYQAMNLTPGTKYTFQVTALAYSGISGASSTANGETYPATPTGLNATLSSDGDVDLNWNPVAGETGYVLEHSPDGSSWTPVGSPSDSTSATDSPSSPMTYSYRVKATNDSGDSDYSPTIQVSVVPTSPSGLTATLNPDNTVSLSWSDNSSNETGFNVEQSSDGINFSSVHTTSANTTQYNASGLSLASVYSFRITATDAAGDSAPSNIATVAMPLERVIVPVSGAVVNSQTKLFNGEAYTIRASGTAYLGVPPDGYGDAEYGSLTNPQNNGAAQYGSIDYGIAINDPTVTSSKTPFWGAYTSTHVYTTSFTGLGQTLQFNYHDDFPNDNSGSLNADILDPYTLGLTAHRTGDNFGTAVSNSVVQSGDPSQYVVLVDDDYQVHTDKSVTDNGSSTADVDGTDTDLAKITLNQIPNYLTTGTVTLSLSNSSSVRLFKSDGTQFSSSDMTMNLASPSGYLAGLMSGTVDIWVQGMAANPDLVFKLAYKDTNGKEVARQTVHMLLADWQFMGMNADSPITSVDKTDQKLLMENSTADPNDPSIGDSALFKNNIIGLPTADVVSLTMTSDSVSSDSYTDTYNYDSANTVSANWATIYTPIDGGDDLTADQISFLQQHDDLNVVHNPQGDGKLDTPQDEFKRVMAAQAAKKADDVYNLFKNDTNTTLSNEVTFLLDRMDYNGDGNDYHKRLIVTTMHPAQEFAVDSAGNVYIGSGGTDQQTEQWALDGLRLWAARGAHPGWNVTGKQLQEKEYFSIIARQFARHFYWTIDPHTLPWSENLTAPTPGSHAAYTGTVSPTKSATAAVDALSQTFDFLYLFSSANSSAMDATKSDDMYSPLLTFKREGDLPTNYLFIFSNRVDPQAKGGTVYEVNIPSAGMNFDYYEKDLLDPTNKKHNTQPVNTGPFKGSWPDEDQTHHFAGYFYSGALLQLSPYSGDSYLVKALKGTGDYYVKINGVQTIANSGDYDLGVVGWDMGVAYEKNKSNISSTINTYLTSPFTTVNAMDGRGTNLP